MQSRNNLVLRVLTERLAQGTHDKKNWGTKTHTVSGIDDIVAAGQTAELIGNSSIRRRAEDYKQYADDVRDIGYLSTPRKTPLVTAVASSHANAVRDMLSDRGHILGNARHYPYPPRADLANAAHDQLLHWSLRQPNPEITELLLRHGANTERRNEFGGTALHHIPLRGKRNPNHMRALLEHGAVVNALDDSRRTPLHKAAASGNFVKVRLLLQSGADVNARDAALKTPLYYAVEAGNVGVVKILLMHGASVHAADIFDRTPLDRAKSKLRTWRQGNFREATNMANSTWGVKREARKKIVEMLIKAGAA